MELSDCKDCHELAADLREVRAELSKIKTALKAKIDHGAWFYQNCKRQRRNGAKICNSCPFRVLIEATE